MATDTTVNELIINKLTQAQYDALTEKSPTELYFVTDAKDNSLPLDVIDSVEKFPQCTVEDLGKLVIYTGPTTESTQESVQLVLDGTIYSGHIFGCIEVNVMMSENESVAYYMWKDVYESIPTIGDNVTGKVLSNNGLYPEWVDMPEGDKLPDQTDNAGKFLMTDGTTASWGNAISIKEQGVGNEGVIAIGTGDMKYGNYNTNSVIIGKGDHGQGYGAVVAIGSNAKVTASSSATIAIGYDAQAGYGESVVIGSHSKQAPNYGNGGQVTIGSWCTSSGSRAIVLGYECAVDGNYAIQLGGKKATNSDANTFKVGNENGNFEMLSVDGTIPTDRYTTTPTDAGTYVPKLTIAEDGTATREWSTESGGTMVVATPPTDNGTYVLKATVVDGVVTTEWVLEA